MKHSSTQDVDVEMKHRLAGPRSVVDNGAEPFRIDVALARQLSRDGEEMPQEWFIFLLGFFERSDVVSRNQQKVHGGLGIQVLERYDAVILVDDFRRRLTLNDAAEYATSHVTSMV